MPHRTAQIIIKAIFVTWCSLLFVIAAAAQTVQNPVLVFVGQEHYTAQGKNFVRYHYSVDNYDSYPQAMFDAAPDLPPCGSNTKASRTWVDLFDQTGKRLYGFCAIDKPAGLAKLWFALEENVVAPSWVYLELNDRKTNAKYKSNLAETIN